MDECTQDFIRLILSLEPAFSEGLEGLHPTEADPQTLAYPEDARSISEKILHGSFRFQNGEERLFWGEDQNSWVKMSYASSGQQSAVWISNLICYYMAARKPACLIIEEPELNLFPESQKYIADLTALAAHAGMQIIVATHSPYILGEYNNILLASGSDYSASQRKKLRDIIPDDLCTEYSSWFSYFVSDGTIADLKDDSIHQMDSDRLDAISSVINDTYDRIAECTLREEDMN